MDDLSSFAIQNPKQIINNLLLVFKHQCLFKAYFGANNESYITTLLDINEKNNTVVLDSGPHQDLNQRIVNADKITFDADYNGIKVSFTGTGLKKITHQGDPAFSMAIPKSLFWLQRREYHRVKLPLSNPGYCQLMAADQTPVNLKLYDISLTGFSMLNDSKDISDLLIPGASFERCKLTLAEAGEGVISFDVCAKYVINPDKLHKIQKIGCKFIKLTRPVEESIQRYMQQIQREDLQKE